MIVDARTLLFGDCYLARLVEPGGDYSAVVIEVGNKQVATLTAEQAEEIIAVLHSEFPPETADELEDARRQCAEIAEAYERAMHRVSQLEHNEISKLEYFAARAPAQPQAWFSPVMPPDTDDPRGLEYSKQRLIQWPMAWAKAVLEAQKINHEHPV